MPGRLTNSESGEDPFHDVTQVAQVEDADITAGSYVVAKYVTERKSKLYYVGCIISTNSENHKVKYLRKVPGTKSSFAYPNIGVITSNVIVLLLGGPVVTGGTKRVNIRLTFEIDMSDYSGLQ